MRHLPMLQVAASGVVDLVLSFAKSKEEKGLKKGDGAKRSRLVGACP
jgi:ABC-type tungstate transport system permease subunit